MSKIRSALSNLPSALRLSEVFCLCFASERLSRPNASRAVRDQRYQTERMRLDRCPCWVFPFSVKLFVVAFLGHLVAECVLGRIEWLRQRGYGRLQHWVLCLRLKHMQYIYKSFVISQLLFNAYFPAKRSLPLSLNSLFYSHVFEHRTVCTLSWSTWMAETSCTTSNKLASSRNLRQCKTTV